LPRTTRTATATAAGATATRSVTERASCPLLRAGAGGPCGALGPLRSASTGPATPDRQERWRSGGSKRGGRLAWVCSGAASSTARGRGRADEEEGGRRKRGRGRRTQGDALTRQQNFQRLLQVRQVTNVVIGSSEASSASGSTWSWYPPAPCTSHR
ncbi:unnamed protein product, partial [Prorocentrum cordatum]